MFGDDEDADENFDHKASTERPKSCGVLQFHNGTEEAMFIFVSQNANAGDIHGIIKAIDVFCYQRHWMMHLGDRKSKFLETYVLQVRNQFSDVINRGEVCVELGSYCGYSSLHIARLLSSQGLLICIEKETSCVNWTKRLLNYAGIPESKVVILHGTVESVIHNSQLLQTLQSRRQNQKINFLFIDHDKKSYKNDLDLLVQQQLFITGSIVVADNIFSFNQPLNDYLNYVRDSDGPWRTIETIHDFVEYSIPFDFSLNSNSLVKVTEQNSEIIDGMEISIFK